ncbi:MAG: electron transfer flavoprotein subunit beta/FixA family protein [Nitrospirota bacterium]|jgi:electron transfer flavoprotein beta subunit
MNIIVCIKQVPDTSEVKINPETNTLVREGVSSIINPFDMFAIEEGLRIKERTGGGKVTAISMGPPQAMEALREAFSLGVDEVFLISDRAFAGSDTLATSYILSKAVEKIGYYDIILCGKQAIDGDTAQVGPEMAEHLGIPFVTYVKKIDEIKDDRIRVHRMMDEGYEVVETKPPVLFTVVKEINEPRPPSLKRKIAAKNLQVSVWTTNDLNVDEERIGLRGSPTQVLKTFPPETKGEREILQGNLEEQVDKLVSELKELGIV